MNSKLFLFSISCFFILEIDNKQIKLSKRTIEDNTFETKEQVYLPFIFKMKIGTPPKEFEFAVDTTYHLLWLPNEKVNFFKKPFKQSDSSTFNSVKPVHYITIQFFDAIITGNEVYDKISNPFEDNNDKTNAVYNKDSIFKEDFYWLLSDYTLFEYFSADGSIGFARKYSSPSFSLNSNIGATRNSFIDFLLKEGVIKEKIFSITKTSPTSGLLSIGEYDKKTFDRTDKGKCYCAKKGDSFYYENIDDFWNCQVMTITLGDTVIPTSSVSKDNAMIFGTNTEFIYAPLENGLRIFDSISKLLQKDAYCASQKDMNGHKLLCEKFDYSNMKAITLTMQLDGGYKLIAYSKDLWKRFNETHLLFNLIALNQANHWKIGEPMLTSEHLLFNYDESSITMVRYEESNWVLYLIIGGAGLVVVILIIVGILLYLKYKKGGTKLKKERKEEKEKVEGEKEGDGGLNVNDVAKGSLTGLLEPET